MPMKQCPYAYRRSHPCRCRAACRHPHGQREAVGHSRRQCWSPMRGEDRGRGSHPIQQKDLQYPYYKTGNYTCQPVFVKGPDLANGQLTAEQKFLAVQNRRVTGKGDPGPSPPRSLSPGKWSAKKICCLTSALSRWSTLTSCRLLERDPKSPQLKSTDLRLSAVVKIPLTSVSSRGSGRACPIHDASGCAVRDVESPACSCVAVASVSWAWGTTFGSL